MRVAPGLMLLLALVVRAQDITKGSIAGMVYDPTGAIIPGVTVKLTSPFGDRKAITNGLGEYNFLNLVVGPGYTLTLDHQGFTPAKITNLLVGVNRQTTQDISLQVGATSQTVDVTVEGGATIDVSTTTIGASLTESLFKNIP